MSRLFRRMWLALLVAAIGLAGGEATAQAVSRAREVARIDVLDVGQGDSILIRSPEGRSVLVDAGPSSVVVDRLRELGVEALDMVVVSHQHSDHYGGMRAVIEAFEPRYYVSAGTQHVTPMYVRLLTVVRDRRMVALQTTRQSRRVQVGSVELVILPQPPESLESENDNSVGIRVEYGQFAMLLTGDSEDAERRWWMENVPELVRDCQVMKLAHHGSHNGTDEAWLRLVRPDLAVCSCGVDNRFGHPHSATLKRLARAGIPVRRTDEEGRITIRTNGRDWRVTTERGSDASGRDSMEPPVAAEAGELVSSPGHRDTSVRSAGAEAQMTAEPALRTGSRESAWKRRR